MNTSNSSHKNGSGGLLVNQFAEPPVGNLAGFKRYFRYDFVSGLMVFLIALPLCLGISLASGFPPLAGIFTAIIGALVAPMISNSELTIKGPAAGMIVIVLGCVEAFGGDGMVGGWSEADQVAYRATLAVGVVAALLQIFFGLFRAGIIGDFFPGAAVHGLLAAIGVIIISKQIPVALGVSAKGEPLELLREIPHFIVEANPAIAFIGVLSVLIMFGWPLVGKKFALAKKIPSPVIVLATAIPLGMLFDLLHEHSYQLLNHRYQLGEQYLVSMPEKMFGIFQEIQPPDFSALARPVAWQWVLMFFMIGSLESILSAKAVDLLDPWKRKTNLDRDVIGVGAGNLAAAMVGGLPMISEIVRSKANIDSGARTRFGNFWHGLFLLACVSLIPTVLHRIPLAALAGMLIYTGIRLAHPKEFINVYRIGKEQLLIFVVTLVAVLMTDLLIGIIIGIALKLVLHVSNGVPLKSLFRSPLKVNDIDGQTVRIEVGDSAIFTNWIPLRRQIEQNGLFEGKSVELDMSNTKIVDHSVMEKLHEMEREFDQNQLTLSVKGLEGHVSATDHYLSSRHRGLASIRRLTLITEPCVEAEIRHNLMSLGASGYTATPCSGMGKHDFATSQPHPEPRIRIEIIGKREAIDKILAYLADQILPHYYATACVETVDVLRIEQFTSVTTESAKPIGAHTEFADANPR
jgi:MFS superfamily sulfate permease-like transporter